MAAQGRTTRSSSVFQGSTEDYDYNCDACLTSDQQVEAYGYCFDCKDYLCITCYKSHGKNRASRHHKLLDNIDNIPANASTLPEDTCVDKCSVHANEIIKFFCVEHSILGCSDCVTLEHRTCTIDYIPEKCQGIEDTTEYSVTIQKLSNLLEQSNAVKAKATDKICELEQTQTNVVDDINRFQKELNEHIDELKKQSIHESERVKKLKENDIRNVIDTCDELTSNIRQIQSSLKHTTAAKLDCQTYVSVKRGENLVTSQDIKVLEKALEKIGTKFMFERNTDIASSLCQTGFGKLSGSAAPVVPVRTLHRAADSCPSATLARAYGIHGPHQARVQSDPLSTEEWYHGEIDRFDADKRLTAVGQDGTFLVRKSIHGDKSQPYSLAVLYSGHIYNIKIRKTHDGKMVLGEDREGIRNHVSDMLL
ncbi:E3 ubiquitin-protein ligase TRIM71-like isoform X2 [Mercenaria mercenaria]|uniref:E3 ubiquitin-protein ligase TRIM71-like isoform X2 n=1 Tax=Mercenaria mercenaria TaxID=6596 RepID=UPI00234ECB37|nr:E3 ubiquitin-protein ligase TRIM71-like isoform X2 [Mercenaria mercenaria]